MLLIVDTNVIFSFFNRESVARRIVLSGKVKLFAPKFLLEEIEEHKQEIKEKFGLNDMQISIVLELVKTFIDFIPLDEFKDKVPEAKNISPDPDDIQFLALALKLDIPLWSEDKALKQQNVVKVFNTSELVKFLDTL